MTHVTIFFLHLGETLSNLSLNSLAPQHYSIHFSKPIVAQKQIISMSHSTEHGELSLLDLSPSPYGKIVHSGVLHEEQLTTEEGIETGAIPSIGDESHTSADTFTSNSHIPVLNINIMSSTVRDTAEAYIVQMSIPSIPPISEETAAAAADTNTTSMKREREFTSHMTFSPVPSRWLSEPGQDSRGRLRGPTTRKRSRANGGNHSSQSKSKPSGSTAGPGPAPQVSYTTLSLRPIPHLLRDLRSGGRLSKVETCIILRVLHSFHQELQQRCGSAAAGAQGDWGVCCVGPKVRLAKQDAVSVEVVVRKFGDEGDWLQGDGVEEPTQTKRHKYKAARATKVTTHH